MTHVVLVDENDNEVGIMEKMEAHRKGILHRALSILLFNSKGELMLQKRAENKYHSGGLWTNTCCSHPLPGETMEDATRRSLLHEMGISLQPEFAYKFLYFAEVDDGLKEHELDYVFAAKYDGEPSINPQEVADWQFLNIATLKKDIEENPSHYSSWFRLIVKGHEFDRFLKERP
jgi:isopentenyl-diphosphate Delta-isomerase